MIVYTQPLACIGDPETVALRVEVICSEAVAAGDYVTVYDVAGVATCRLAIATDEAHLANGFVLQSRAAGAYVNVYGFGANDAVTAQTPGVVYLSATVAGKGTSTAPTLAQQLGFALNAALVLFQRQSPGGGGGEAVPVLASEALIAGPVRVYDNAGTANVKKASAASVATTASGFVKAAFASGAVAQVYGAGVLTGLTGLTPGPQFLGVTAGSFTSSAPTGAGQQVQELGFAHSATAMVFQRGTPFERV